MTVEAGTLLARDVIARLRSALASPAVAAASGSLLPRRMRTIWDRGRYFAALLESAFRPTEDFHGRPLVAQGRFCMYRADAVRRAGGWSSRTRAPDIDLTWTLYGLGLSVRVVHDAVGYSLEPHGLRACYGQLRRRTQGLAQNLRLHARTLSGMTGLRLSVVAALWDSTVALVAYLAVIPALTVALGHPWPLLLYVIDLPAFAVPVLVGAHRRGETRRALTSLPAFAVYRMVSTFAFAGVVWSEAIWRLRGRAPAYQRDTGR
jgi:biofilm PGA synthesis N-glycosyltransferase PgaC